MSGHTPAPDVYAEAQRLHDRAALYFSREWTPPHINRKHVDGPLLVFSDGTLHWLTWGERFALMFGRTDAEKLQRKHKPTIARTAQAGDE